MKYDYFHTMWVAVESVFLCFAVGWMIFCLFDNSMNPIRDFSRSGSLAIACVIMFEFGHSFRTRDLDRVQPLTMTVSKYVSMFAYVLAVIGTCIWGYGDILKRSVLGATG